MTSRPAWSHGACATVSVATGTASAEESVCLLPAFSAMHSCHAADNLRACRYKELAVGADIVLGNTSGIFFSFINFSDYFSF